MKAHWVPPLLCVWPFGGVSLPGYRGKEEGKRRGKEGVKSSILTKK
jgi:hypothetical protein